MNKLLLLGAMLALMAVAAIPALAQQKAGGGAGEESGGAVAANPTPDADRSDGGEVSYSADPADGTSDTLAPAPTGAEERSVSRPKSGSEDGCSGKDGVSLASAPADDAGGSVTLASEPGCDYVTVEQ